MALQEEMFADIKKLRDGRISHVFAKLQSISVQYLKTIPHFGLLIDVIYLHHCEEYYFSFKHSILDTF